MSDARGRAPSFLVAHPRASSRSAVAHRAPYAAARGRAAGVRRGARSGGGGAERARSRCRRARSSSRTRSRSSSGTSRGWRRRVAVAASCACRSGRASPRSSTRRRGASISIGTTRAEPAAGVRLRERRRDVLRARRVRHAPRQAVGPAPLRDAARARADAGLPGGLRAALDARAPALWQRGRGARGRACARGRGGRRGRRRARAPSWTCARASAASIARRARSSGRDVRGLLGDQAGGGAVLRGQLPGRARAGRRADGAVAGGGPGVRGLPCQPFSRASRVDVAAHPDANFALEALVRCLDATRARAVVLENVQLRDRARDLRGAAGRARGARPRRARGPRRQDLGCRRRGGGSTSSACAARARTPPALAPPPRPARFAGWRHPRRRGRGGGGEGRAGPVPKKSDPPSATRGEAISISRDPRSPTPRWPPLPRAARRGDGGGLGAASTWMRAPATLALAAEVCADLGVAQPPRVVLALR